MSIPQHASFWVSQQERAGFRIWFYLDQIFFLLSLSLIPWTWSLLVLALLWDNGAWVVPMTGLVVGLTALVILGGSDFLATFLSCKEVDMTQLFSASLLLNSLLPLIWRVESLFPLNKVEPWLIWRFTEFEDFKMRGSFSLGHSPLMQLLPKSGVAFPGSTEQWACCCHCCSRSLYLSSSSFNCHDIATLINTKLTQTKHITVMKKNSTTVSLYLKKENNGVSFFHHLVSYSCYILYWSKG